MEKDVNVVSRIAGDLHVRKVRAFAACGEKPKTGMGDSGWNLRKSFRCIWRIFRSQRGVQCYPDVGLSIISEVSLRMRATMNTQQSRSQLQRSTSYSIISTVLSNCGRRTQEKQHVQTTWRLARLSRTGRSLHMQEPRVDTSSMQKH